MKELLFSKIGEYIQLNEADRQIIDSLFKLEEYKANDTILREGSICNTLWFMAKGLIRYSTNTDGEERTFLFRNEGCFFSDIEGLLKNTAASKSIFAIEDCVMYRITKSDLQLLYAQVSQGEKFGRLLIESIFIGAVGHIVSFYTESPEQRYVNLIKHNKDFISRIPQYHIASFLGVRPQSLCRIKKRLLSSDL